MIAVVLGLMSGLSWGVADFLGGFFSRRLPAIVVAALVFGAAHLPAAFAIWGFGAANIARTLVLNGIAGLVFGALYWRRGLEHAMAAHFSADLVLHVIAPL